MFNWVRGVGKKSFSMEADVEAFLGSPTAEQLDRFKKKDLLQLADALKISVVVSAKKTKD